MLLRPGPAAPAGHRRSRPQPAPRPVAGALVEENAVAIVPALLDELGLPPPSCPGDAARRRRGLQASPAARRRDARREGGARPAAAEPGCPSRRQPAGGGFLLPAAPLLAALSLRRRRCPRWRTLRAPARLVLRLGGCPKRARLGSTQPSRASASLNCLCATAGEELYPPARDTLSLHSRSTSAQRDIELEGPRKHSFVHDVRDSVYFCKKGERQRE